MKNKRNTFIRRLAVLSYTALMTIAMATPAQAAGLMDTKLYTGGLQLIADATTIAAIACPLVAALLWIFFSIARQAAQDEPTEKKWNKCMRGAIIFGVAGCLGSGLISAISSYFAG